MSARTLKSVERNIPSQDFMSARTLKSTKKTFTLKILGSRLKILCQWDHPKVNKKNNSQYLMSVRPPKINQIKHSLSRFYVSENPKVSRKKHSLSRFCVSGNPTCGVYIYIYHISISISTYLSRYLSRYVLSVYLSIYLSVCLSVCLSFYIYTFFVLGFRLTC